MNSVNGELKSMEAIFPLVKKYGANVVALTLDEDGIPKTADKRLEIARKIIKRLKIFIKASKRRNEPLDHTLLDGTPGSYNFVNLM